MTRVAIVGGTGPLGRGLAARWARAGVEVTIGSRDPDRAAEAAAKVRDRLEGDGLEVASAGNLDAVDGADLSLLAVPYGALDGVAETLGSALAGRIVVSVINPLGADDDGPFPLQIEEGSAAVACARRLPRSRVVAAFHSVSSRQLGRLDERLDEDVPIFGDDEEAVAEVAALAARIDGLRPVPVGSLRLAGPVEGMTAVIIAINRRHGRQVGLRFSHLDP